MMTGFASKFLAVGDEACSNVVHCLHLHIHCEMEFSEDFVFPPHSDRSLPVIKLVLLSARFKSFDAGVVEPDQAHALGSLGVNDPVIDFLNLLGPVVKVWWRYPGSNPWFRGAGWHCQRAEFRSIHQCAKRDNTWRVVFPPLTVLLQHLFQSLHVLNDVLSLILRSDVINPCNDYYLSFYIF